jgi:transcriptional regulator with XRE-family HTH domain
MSENWGALLRQFRARNGLTQVRTAALIGVPPRVIGRWERNQDEPAPYRKRQIRDLAFEPGSSLSWQLREEVARCPLPRSIASTPNLRLEALSQPAVIKRPSIVEWIGRDLAPIAEGLLAEMLDDAPLQRSIAKGEIYCIFATSKGVLRTEEQEHIGAFQTTISYFFQDGVLFSDALSVPAPDYVPFGYRVVPMDNICDSDF